MVIVRTGTANHASVVAALRRCGVEPEPTTDPEVVRSAERVVLPGVGTFGAAMAALREAGLVEALQERVRADRPLLAVCVGMQVLCDASEESPGVQGLSVVSARVARFEGDLRVPHMGWSAVQATAGAVGIDDGYAYFAHSYRLSELPEGFEGAVADHGGAFVAAMQRGSLLALQCHPELSGRWGAGVLRSWVED
ncbi:MAG: imidazole glycerol phosphate synthase subunit HisH [Myxococcales bacterium]|nr:imidazole glycerol phosphate synthase subunit HisH [Myxococcales bacterium]